MYLNLVQRAGNFPNLSWLDGAGASNLDSFRSRLSVLETGSPGSRGPIEACFYATGACVLSGTLTLSNKFGVALVVQE